MKSASRPFLAVSLATASAILANACSSDGVSPVAATPDAGLDSNVTPDTQFPVDATTSKDAPSDAVTDVRAEDAPPPILKRVSGHVDYMGAVAGAKVTVLAPPSHAGTTTTTDANGDFFFYVPLGSAAIFKVEATNLFPMIRGVTVGDTNRIRNFYLAGQPEKDAAQALGLTVDPTKGIVEIDFRNAAIGGYGVTMKSGTTTTTPGFGIALDSSDNPVQSTTTVTGGDGSTLLLGNVTPATVSFTPIVPGGASLPCKPCDASNLPVQAGVVTWFDFECGSATDCQ